jgi:pimeloyl-ACP methyl ester carboxylesterase
VLPNAGQLDCERFVQVGYSFGGAIAAGLAVEHSARLSVVVEVDPAYAVKLRNPLLVSRVMPPSRQTSLARQAEAMDNGASWES